MVQDKSELPWVTCVCPTFGRFSLLQDVVTCFLEQDYPKKRLLILNDAKVPLRYEGPESVVIHNTTEMFANLGLKRQAMLQMADTELIAHWDDDDLYLPWYLSRSVAALQRAGADCVRSQGAWYMIGSLTPQRERGALYVKGISNNGNFEGTMLFRREAALKAGGYAPMHSGQALVLHDAFRKNKKLHITPNSEGKATTVAYVYRWGQKGVGHISSIAAVKNSDPIKRFLDENRDFGDAPLRRADLSPYWAALRDSARAVLAGDDLASFERKFG
jgi:hypothetical protein